METTLLHRNTIKTSLLHAVLGGIVGTLPMSAIMYLRPKIGWADWPVPHVLSGIMNVPLFGGWIAHFLVGIIFAIIYLFTFNRIPIKSKILKGALFGIPAYGVAFGTWLILEACNLIHFENYSYISYPYLIEHIVFAACMAPFIPKWRSEGDWIY